MYNKDLKWHFQKDRINYIVKEYLGCSNDFILEDLDFTYNIIDTCYKIIEKYENDKRNIHYIFMSDYEEGRASDNYDNINFLEDFSGIYVYEIKGVK